MKYYKADLDRICERLFPDLEQVTSGRAQPLIKATKTELLFAIAERLEKLVEVIEGISWLIERKEKE